MIGTIAAAGVGALLPWLLNKIFDEQGGGQQPQGGIPQQYRPGIDPYDQGGQSPPADFWWGNPERVAHIPQFTQEQLPVLSQLMQSGLGQLQNPYGGFEPLEQQARTNFAQKTVPSLAERFTSMGQNRLTSPLFATQMGQAGAGLEQNLAAMKSMYGMQNRAQGLDMLQMGLTPQFQNLKMAAQPGAVQGMTSTLLPALVNAGGEFAKQGSKSYWKGN